MVEIRGDKVRLGIVAPKEVPVVAAFHARFPGLRFPLDHILHSTHFRLVGMRVLPYVGSDHFPVVATLSFEPDAAAKQEAPKADAADEQESRDTIAEGGSR